VHLIYSKNKENSFIKGKNWKILLEERDALVQKFKDIENVLDNF